MTNRPRPRGDDEPSIGRPREVSERLLELMYIAHIDRTCRQAEVRGGGLDGLPLPHACPNFRIAQHSDVCDLRLRLLEKFKPLSAQAVVKARKACSIAA